MSVSEQTNVRCISFHFILSLNNTVQQTVPNDFVVENVPSVWVLAEVQGFKPLGELQGLQPLGELQGLQPLGELQGLQPLGELQGLQPLVKLELQLVITEAFLVVTEEKINIRNLSYVLWKHVKVTADKTIKTFISQYVNSQKRVKENFIVDTKESQTCIWEHVKVTRDTKKN